MKMKKLVIPMSLLLLISSCNNQQRNPALDIKEDFTTKLFEGIKGNNFTLETISRTYYYPIEDDRFEESTEIVENFKVTAKVTDDKYSLKALDILHGETNRVATSFQYEKDQSTGLMVSKYINKNNELVVENAVDGTGQTIPWEEGAYVNWLTYLDEEDLYFDLETKTFILEDYNNKKAIDLFTNFFHTAFPSTNFDLDEESLTISINENDEVVVYMIDRESNDVYEGENLTYGRDFKITIKDLGKTSVSSVTPFEEKEENEPLKIALDSIKEKMMMPENFRTSVTPFVDGVAQDTITTTTFAMDEETFLPQVLVESLLDGGIVRSGFYYDLNSDTYFEVFQDSPSEPLIGVPTEMDPFEFIPTFDFSAGIFDYINEEDGIKKYKLKSGFQEVLDYVDFGVGHSGNMSNDKGEDIYFFVKDNQLAYIEYPGFLQTGFDSYVNSVNRISYDFDDIYIDEDAFSDLVINIEPLSGWDDPRLVFDFKVSSIKDDLEGKEEYIEGLSVTQLFKDTCGEDFEMPFFLGDISSTFSVEGSIQYDEIYNEEEEITIFNKQSSLLSIFFDGYTLSGEEISSIDSILTSSGFEAIEEGAFYVSLVNDEEIAISIFNDVETGFFAVDFELPLGIYGD